MMSPAVHAPTVATFAPLAQICPSGRYEAPLAVVPSREPDTAHDPLATPIDRFDDPVMVGIVNSKYHLPAALLVLALTPSTLGLVIETVRSPPDRFALAPLSAGFHVTAMRCYSVLSESFG